MLEFRKAMSQESYLLLFSVFVNDVPRMPVVEVSLFADHKITLVADAYAVFAVLRLQRQLGTRSASHFIFSFTPEP